MLFSEIEVYAFKKVFTGNGIVFGFPPHSGARRLCAPTRHNPKDLTESEIAAADVLIETLVD